MSGSGGDVQPLLDFAPSDERAGFRLVRLEVLESTGAANYQAYRGRSGAIGKIEHHKPIVVTVHPVVGLQPTPAASAAWLTDGEQLEILDLHIEHLCRPQSKGLHDAIRLFAVHAALQRNRVRDDVCIKPNRLHRLAAAQSVLLLERLKIR